MIVIDGNNIAYHRKSNGKPMVSNIQLILDYWSKMTEVITIIKASLIYKVDNFDALLSMANNGQVTSVPGQFDDDEIILRIAYDNDAFILSNDKFRQYTNYPIKWVKQHRIEYLIINGRVYCSKNPFDTTIPNLKIDQAQGSLSNTSEANI